VGVLVSTIDTLIARKRLLYPQVREYILTHQLSFVDNKVTLSVGTAPVPEHIQRIAPLSGKQVRPMSQRAYTHVRAIRSVHASIASVWADQNLTSLVVIDHWMS